MSRIADAFPVIALLWRGWRPIGYAIGFKTAPFIAHLERFYVHPKHRSWRNIRTLGDAWHRAVRRRGAEIMTARILRDDDRYRVKALAMRDKWCPYKQDSRFVWYMRRVT